MTKNIEKKRFRRIEKYEHKREEKRDKKKEHSLYIPAFFGLGLAVMLLFTMVCVASAATYYASPSGGGDGSSPSMPFQIADFWPVAKPGDTLILLDGTYTGSRSMISPPSGLSGASSSPITIKALNDGKVTIDGQKSRLPIRLSNSNWFIIEGINACRGSSAVIDFYSSSHNILRRICAWDGADGNNHIYRISYGSKHNLFEDCAGWGRARKIFQAYWNSDYNTARRFFAMLQSHNPYQPGIDDAQMGMTSYYSTGNIFENCVITFDKFPDSTARVDIFLLGADTETLTDKKTKATLYWYGNIVYTKNGQRGTIQKMVQAHGFGGRGIYNRGFKQFVARDILIYDDGGGSSWGLYTQELDHNRGYEYLFYEDFDFKDITVIRNGGVNIHTSYGVSSRHSINNAITIGGSVGFEALSGDYIGDYIWAYKNAQNFKGGKPQHYRTDPIGINTLGGNILQYGLIEDQRPKVNGEPVGAQIQYRYVNGVLTNEPLWPWPMNQRIIDAMIQSGREPIDVTKTVFELDGGTMPDFGATGTISGTVIDNDTGNPIEGATVSANSYSNTTNSTGGYTITLPGGTYTVTASKTGYFAESQENVEVLEDLTTTVNFRLTEAPDLVGLWHFDEGSGTTAADSSEYGNGGTLFNGPAWVDGKVGKALSFDGVGYVDCGNSASLDITGPITIMLWIKPAVTGEGGPNAGPVCKAEAGVDWNWQLRYNAPGDGNYMGFQFNGDPEGSTWVSAKQTLSPGEWYHITGTFDGTNIRCYLNGVEKDTNQISAIKGGSSTLFIGQDGWDNIFNGVIDEVKIYNRALSAEDIMADYEAGVNSTYPRYDVNEDGKVDDLDITIVAQHYGETTNPPYSRYDVNEDGKVDISDTTIVGQHFGEITS